MPNWKKVIVSGSDASLSTLLLSDVVNAGTDTDKFLVLDSSNNVDFRTGTQVLSDIGGVSSTNGITTPIQLMVDTKSLSAGYVSWFAIADLQPNGNRAYTTWIPPVNGYLEEVLIAPELANTTTDDLDLLMLIDGSPVGSVVTQTMGAIRVQKTFTFGSGTYAFSAGDRISLAFDKNTNTSALWSVMVHFKLDS